MQIPARPPATAAMTAATLDALSDGRFRLGLGVSNPDVSEGWYGVPFDGPLGRTREYVEIVRAALKGAPVTYVGSHFQLPSGTRASAPLHLYTERLRPTMPIYLAAVGPQNLRLAGRIADGWLGVFVSPGAVAEAREEIEKGLVESGREPAGYEVIPCVPTAVDDDPRAAADQLRGQYAYLLGIGDRQTSVYCSLARRLGFGAAVDEIHRHLESGDRAAAQRAVPTDLIDATALIGPRDRIQEGLRSYAAAGATTVSIMVSAAATDRAGRLVILETCASAASGVTGPSAAS
jgi:F420-dependent oxidoreductase-like protein